jgi:hypothetical protein
MIAYNTTWLFNLGVSKETKRWLKQDIISESEYIAIREAYPSSFYHPNVFIRVMLFLATLVALGGVTGLLGLLVGDVIDGSIEIMCLVYGLASWAFLEVVFIKKGQHYKSGVNEALLYHSIGWTIGGLTAMSDFNEHIVIVTCIIIFSFAAIRYADLISTVFAFLSLVYLVFHECYSAGGIFEQIIPIVFLVVFAPFYFLVRSFASYTRFDAWSDCLTVLEGLALLTIYAAGNYFIVRELSGQLMNVYVEPGNDIPFAWLFYSLTVLIPVLYLYFGLKRKDVILLRVSLIVLAFSVFTFKYYFSLGHPEITLTVAGAILLTLALYLFRYLKTPRHGYTRENLLRENWAGANPEAFIISQTMGGNQVSQEMPVDVGGGGSTAGGGSSDSF